MFNKQIKNILLFIIGLVVVVNGGLIHHDSAGLGDDHHRATSYQNIHMEHFHPVPTYIKKEHHELLEHPVSIGKSSSKVEIHHGGKHDHGYALAHVDNDVHGHGHGFESSGLEGHYDLGGAAQLTEDHSQAGYGIQEGYEYAQHGIEDSGASLGHYQLESGAADLGGGAEQYYGHHE